MSVIQKKKTKRDRGVMFKIMNRDPDDPLYHDPNVSNRVLVYAPSRSDMKKRKLDDAKEEIIMQVTEEEPSMDIPEDYDESKDQVDYALDQLKKDLEEGEGEGDYEGDDEYYEAYELEAEGDEDYEFMGFNNKVDREFAKDVKQNFNYKPAAGIRMVEYDAFGLPKTKEMEIIKRELNMKEDNDDDEDEVNVMYIKPPEEYVLNGYYRNVDIERKHMNKEMREVFDLMEDDKHILEDDCIDDDFLMSLNGNQPAMIPIENNEEETKEEKFDEDEDEMDAARREADEFMNNMPPELSLEMQLKLANARKHLALKNKEAEENPEIQAHIDNDFEGILNEYDDGEIGCVNDDDLQNFVDEIDASEFEDIIKGYLTTKKRKYKRTRKGKRRRIVEENKEGEGEGEGDVESDLEEEFSDNEPDPLNTSTDIKKAMFKLFKQQNGEVVRLVTREYMKKYTKKLNAKQYAETHESIKQKVLQLADEFLERAEKGEDIPNREENGEGDEETWDVETILTTRTNTDNHPGLIKSVVKVKKNPIKLDPKTAAPELEAQSNLPKPEEKPKGPYIETEIEAEGEDESDEEVDCEDIAKMDKKARKKQLKKERRERRAMKKQMKKEFSKQNQKYAQARTVEAGQIRPGTSIRRL